MKWILGLSSPPSSHLVKKNSKLAAFEAPRGDTFLPSSRMLFNTSNKMRKDKSALFIILGEAGMHQGRGYSNGSVLQPCAQLSAVLELWRRALPQLTTPRSRASRLRASWDITFHAPSHWRSLRLASCRWPYIMTSPVNPCKQFFLLLRNKIRGRNR